MGDSAGNPPKRRRWLRRAVLALAFLAVCLGGLITWRPLAVMDAATRAWLRVMGVRSEYVRLGKYRIHYLTGGDGQPLVLVHGLGGKAENFARAMPVLTRSGFRVYAIDLLGFGRSDRPDVNYSIALQADILRQFMDALDLRQADLGGWSMGGWIVLKFALQNPERIRRLFVADSAGLEFKPTFDPHIFHPQNGEQAGQLMKLLSPEARHIPQFVENRIAAEMNRKGPAVGRAVDSMLTGTDVLNGKLGAIRQPVLIVWGKDDMLIPVSCGEEMHREIPQSVLAIFDGCGHLAPVECSGSVTPEVVRFLKAEPAWAPSVKEIR